jgi:hypothetical protein
MRPVKLTIPGAFWDTQIYAGRLYLFNRDSAILTLDWDQLVKGLPVEKSIRLAATCAFQRSDFLYGDQWSMLFADDDVRELLVHKFERLAARDLVVDVHSSAAHCIATQDNPFPFPHADCTIYKKRMYVVGASGLRSANCNKKTRLPVSRNVLMAWDCPSHALAASYDRVALAAGSEGLYEYAIERWPDVTYTRGRKKNNPRRVSPTACSLCGWAFYSIFGSSPGGEGFLAAFRKKWEGGEEQEATWQREFDRVVTCREIFGEGGVAWAAQDKLCQAVGRSVHVVKYAPWFRTDKSDDKKEFSNLGTIAIPRKNGAIISGGVALFGTVVERENMLVVLLSNGESHAIPGEPVNWRVYPRSKHYENQLHITYDDRVEIWSFNQDYFVDQKTKLSGVSHTGWWPRLT